ncbi:MAG TPA: phosphoglycerate kinase [Thermoanaerobaculia bacterium]|jgi:phosphoglycerate kinase|nr:phosphoglycerate kinase [Thermoanaerobaculia bacterium]
MTRLRTLEHLLQAGLRGRAVFVRADFNVPRDGDRILDDTRIRAAAPTLRELQAAGAKLLVFSHYGRPKGKPRPDQSLRPVVPALAAIVGAEVAFAPDCIGAVAEAAAAATPAGGYCLFENLRFHAGEEANDPQFAAQLARLADVYVDDAFGAAHRAHASIVGVPERVERSAAGRLLAREVEGLERLLAAPEDPFVAILGGAKIKDKIETIENLLPRIDALLLGGAMANTFLRARGCSLGKSLVAEDEVDLAATLLVDAAGRDVEVLLPTDVVVTDRIDRDAGSAAARRIETTSVDAVAGDMMAVDLGPRTLAAFEAAIATARTAFWNGPVGLFETTPFDEGSRRVARALAGCRGYTVIGGGETVAAATQAGVADQIDHVSTGGGASLELLAGRKLPGVEALAHPRVGRGGLRDPGTT